MALQVSNYTVVDNNRTLTNITGIDATTAAAIGAAGVGGGGTIEMTADGSITAGDVVGITGSGKVATTLPLYGPTATSYTTSASTGYVYYQKVAYDAAQNKVVWEGRASANGLLRVRVGTISSNGTTTWGTAYQLSGATNPANIGLAMHNNIIVVTMSASNWGNYRMMVSFGVSGTTINSTSGIAYMEGSYYSVAGGNYGNNYIEPDPNNSGKFMVAYTAENYLYPYAALITATGSSISVSRQRLTTTINNCSKFDIAYSPDYNKFMAVFCGYQNSTVAVDLSVSGGSLSVGTVYYEDLAQDADTDAQLSYDSVNGDYILVTRSGGNAYAWALATNSSGVAQSFSGANTIRSGAGGDYYGRYTIDSSGNTTFGVLGIEGANKRFFVLNNDGNGTISVAQTIDLTPYMDTTFSSNFGGLNGRGTFMALHYAVSGTTTKQSTQINTASSYFKPLGISESTVSNGQTATISITGGITNQVSNLSPGTFYEPSSTSAGDLTVSANKDFALAVKTNELIMR